MAWRKVQVNSQNIGDWIDCFVEYFHELQKLFPPPENTSGPIPTGEQISMGILHIRCLNKLKPVIQFIVQIPEVILALYRSGMSLRLCLSIRTSFQATLDSQRADKLSMTSENAQFVKSFKFESHVNHARQKLASKDVQGYPSVVQDKTENEGEEADYEQEDKDKVENEVEGEKDDLFPVALLGLSGLLQPMYAITAWFLSVRYLSTQARRLLSGREPKVNLLRCPEVQPTKHDNQLVRVEFENLFSDLRMLASEKQLQTLAARCSKAKIHAEAALMARVYCNDSPHKVISPVSIAAGSLIDHFPSSYLANMLLLRLAKNAVTSVGCCIKSSTKESSSMEEGTSSPNSVYLALAIKFTLGLHLLRSRKRYWSSSAKR
ncbi:hypothetical protein F5880DRAFT_1601570 [Lentinula raphanica]|nr:hypothetical protein F5880DRAFT_1601570 [Lentinula raphanica]